MVSFWPIKPTPRPAEPAAAPDAPEPVDDLRDAELAGARVRIAELEEQLAITRAVIRQHRDCGQAANRQTVELRIAGAGGEAEELLRARQTLRRYDDLLAAHEGRPVPHGACLRGCCDADIREEARFKRVSDQ